MLLASPARRYQVASARNAADPSLASSQISLLARCRRNRPGKFTDSKETAPELANPGTTLPPISPEATAFARTGEPSYAGITAESYVGAERREPGTVTLEGDWQTSRQYVELRSGTGKIVLPFMAGEVNLVMQPGASGKAAVAVMLDGKPIGEVRGGDVGTDGVARFDRSGMIRLVAGAPRGRHVLTLVASDPGVRAYVFTFGP